MCGGPGTSPESNQIDAQLRNDAKMFKKETKLLLLGAGECGKSTIVKQMRIIYTEGFSPDELKTFVPIVHQNTIISMIALIKAVDTSTLPSDVQNAGSFLLSEEVSTATSLNSEISDAIKKLWANDIIKTRFDNRSDIQIMDACNHYFNELDRISNSAYVPSEQDVLYSRVKTTGIVEICFSLLGNPFRLVDVGGQRSERRKWIHCFQEVTAIFFIASMSEYDQVLREDASTNRMVESLSLFEEIGNCQWFQATPIILFLNKSDLFAEKIKKIDLKITFPEYAGGCNEEKGSEFIKQKFATKMKNTAKKIYTHTTCATNTENVKFVFAAVQDIFMNKVIGDVGF